MKALLLSCMLLFLMGCVDPCDNKVINSALSPDQSKYAVSFHRDCGATTGFNTQISIFNSKNDLPNKSGNTLIIDGQASFELLWQSSSKLVVKGGLNDTVFLQEYFVNGVQVVYAK